MKLYKFRGVHKDAGAWSAPSLMALLDVVFRSQKNTDVVDLSHRVDFAVALLFEIMLDPGNIDLLLTKVFQLNGMSEVEILCHDEDGHAFWYAKYDSDDTGRLGSVGGKKYGADAPQEAWEEGLRQAPAPEDDGLDPAAKAALALMSSFGGGGKESAAP